MNKKDKKKQHKPQEKPTHRMMTMGIGKEKNNGRTFRTLRHK